MTGPKHESFQVRPLELLLLSFRQLQAGPPVLWQRPPKLFTSHGSEERVGNEDNGDDDDWDCLIVPRNNKPQHLSTPGRFAPSGFTWG